jgi:diguanylate cyclase (GGDEF)-like protein
MTQPHTWEHRTGKALKAFRLDSIKNKMVALALAATLIPTLATLAAFYVQYERALSEKIEEELGSLGSQAARELDIFIRGKRQDMGVFVSSFEVSENLQRIQAGDLATAQAVARVNDYLAAIQNRFPDYTELVVLDDRGEYVASGSGSGEGVALPTGWRDAVRSGRAMVGDPFRESDGGGMSVRIAHPINVPTGERYLGALVAELDLSSMDGLLMGYEPGDGGHTKVITSRGTVIATSGGGPATALAGTGIVTSALEGLTAAEGSTVEYRDGAGERMLGTLHPLSDVPWSVVAEVPRADAYEPILSLRNLALFLVAGLVAIVGGLAYFVGQVIVRPLGRLTAGAAEVAAGDLSVDLPVTGGGEVSYLTVVFNDMVERLRRGREALDQASEELRERNVELERLSVTDGLTGVLNRRRVMEILAEEIDRADRMGSQLGLLMLDVDHFKTYNDTWGHLEGDSVLKAVAASIEDATRDIDAVGRYGGEEFMVLLPGCGAAGGEEASARILSRLAVADFKGGPVSMSIGVASFPEHGDSLDGLIHAADDALYHAKARGRGRFVVAGTAGPMASTGPVGTRRARPRTA